MVTIVITSFFELDGITRTSSQYLRYIEFSTINPGFLTIFFHIISVLSNKWLPKFQFLHGMTSDKEL